MEMKKGEYGMVVFWDHGRGLLVLTIIAVLGLYWRFRVTMRYRRIMKQCESVDVTKDRYLRTWRSQMEELSQMRNGFGNLAVFLQKALRKYRVRGITLHRWNQLADVAAGIDILGGLILAGICFWRNQDIRTIVFYGAAGVVLGSAGILFGILLDNRQKEEQTWICLRDCFENRIFPQITKEPDDRDTWYGRDRPEWGQRTSPVYIMTPEEEAVVEEIFKEYLW